MKQIWLPETIGRELKYENGIENEVGMSRAKVLMFMDKVLKIQPSVPWADREITIVFYSKEKRDLHYDQGRHI